MAKERKFVKDDKFEQQKARFAEKAQASKNTSKSIHAEFLNEIANELKVFINNGVSFTKISQEIDEVFGRKISSITLANYCAQIGIYKRKNYKSK